MGPTHHMPIFQKYPGLGIKSSSPLVLSLSFTVGGEYLQIATIMVTPDSIRDLKHNALHPAFLLYFLTFRK